MVLVRLLASLVDHGGEAVPEIPGFGPETQADLHCGARGELQVVAQRRLGAGVGRVHRGQVVDHMVGDAVFREGRPRRPPKLLQVGVVVAEQGFRLLAVRSGAGGEDTPAVPHALRGHVLLGPALKAQRRPYGAEIPAPAIAEPDRGEHIEGCGVRSHVLDLDLPQDVLRGGLGPGDRDDEEAVLFEDPRSSELVLGLVTAAPGVFGP